MSTIDPAFGVFWAAYPRKVGKGAAEKAWRQVKPDAALVEVMLEALKWQRSQEGWLEESGRFIPHPATWLNQRRWEDEPMDLPHMSSRTVHNLRASADFLARRTRKEIG